MASRLVELFKDVNLVEKIKERLPRLFWMVELESKRGGTTGMQVGSAREAVVVALLIYKFGEENVETDLPITEPEVDVKLFGHPLSIKTCASKYMGGVKLIWTVDWDKVNEFCQSYYPSCDMLFAHVLWNQQGGLYYIPVETQKKLFDRLGRANYIRPPRQGTNPRGVNIDRRALTALIDASREAACGIPIFWRQAEVQVNRYQRWLDYWAED